MGQRTIFDGCDPRANPAAIVESGDARFTILTPAMIRLEHVPDGAFEDRASQAFINRRLDPPPFQVERAGGTLEIRTDELTLRYVEGEPFAAATLSIELQVGAGDAHRRVLWTPGLEDTGNLSGTVRTLDGVSGACPLEPGLLSRDGWVLIDDTERPLFDGDPGWPWMTERSEAHRRGEALDWYFLGYGRDYQRALRDYTRVAGRIPMPPRYVYGSWFSRYWPYTDEEFKGIVREFDEHDVPLDVLVVDMDWHLDGWTGYTWNPRYFPHPEAFLAWCHDEGLRVTLNLHPADGVGRHEAPFHKMRAAVGGDRTMYRVPFDCTDKAFVRAYFDILHHPMEREGVDFWWMDWQQGRETDIPGVDPLWWLNHLHWDDMETNEDRGDARALIFSRWGGLGNHRYQIGFSGDTFNDWESLAFQPYFTATAGNVGYGFWSHDIGGHQPGPVEDELYARWVQYAVFSPILRTHSGRDPRAERRIWTFRPDCFEVMRDAFTLRYELIPYIYASTRRAYDEGVSLCRPLYGEWPERDEAYARTGQYLFGDQLMVYPVTRAASRVSKAAGIDVWVPPGRWTAWHTGHTYEGPRMIRMLVPLDEIPIFAREGAIVPGAPQSCRSGSGAPDPLLLHVFPGQEGSIRHYEDDGVSEGYRRGQCAWTPIRQRVVGDVTTVEIGPVEGAFPGMPGERAYEVRLHASWPASEVAIDGAPVARVEPGVGPGWWYDADELCVVVHTPPVPIGSALEVRVHSALPGEAGGAMGAGLRGQLALLDDVGDVLGAHAPPEIVEARAIRALIARDPAAGAARALSLQRDWRALVTSVGGCGAEEADRDHAQARLLGLSCTVEVGREAPEDGAIEVTADVAFAPRFHAEADLEVDLSLDVSAGWTIDAGAGRQSERLRGGEHRRLSALVRHAGRGRGSEGGDAQPVQVGVAEARVVVRERDSEISVEECRAFCPSINGWWVLGPFHCPFAEQMGTDFIDPTAEVDTRASVRSGDAPARRWQRVIRELRAGDESDGELRIDLNELFGASTEDAIEDAVAYAYCEIQSERRQEVELALGSDDSVVGWLNGREVHSLHANRAYRSREDRVIVTLEEGSNTLMLKIGNATLGWFFGAHIDDLSGRPALGVRVTLPE